MSDKSWKMRPKEPPAYWSFAKYDPHADGAIFVSMSEALAAVVQDALRCYSSAVLMEEVDGEKYRAFCDFEDNLWEARLVADTAPFPIAALPPPANS